VTFEFPLFVSVVLREALLPTFTFPKPKFVGFAPSRRVVATPVPLRAMTVGEVGALLASETLPGTPPRAAGANATLKFELCPGLRVKGKVSPLVENPFPEAVA